LIKLERAPAAFAADGHRSFGDGGVSGSAVADLVPFRDGKRHFQGPSQTPES